MISLTTLPDEVLHHICLLHAEENAGPPSLVPSLSRTCKSLNSSFKFDSNLSFYANLFEYQFDTDALKRRYPAERLTAVSRADELKRRWTLLKEIRTVVA